MNMYTYYTSDNAKAAALRCARGSYQRALLNDAEAWSGAGLQGKARQYGASYYRSRKNLLERLETAGLQPVTLYLSRQHNRRVVII